MMHIPTDPSRLLRSEGSVPPSSGISAAATDEKKSGGHRTYTLNPDDDNGSTVVGSSYVRRQQIAEFSAKGQIVVGCEQHCRFPSFTRVARQPLKGEGGWLYPPLPNRAAFSRRGDVL